MAALRASRALLHAATVQQRGAVLTMVPTPPPTTSTVFLTRGSTTRLLHSMHTPRAAAEDEEDKGVQSATATAAAAAAASSTTSTEGERTPTMMPFEEFVEQRGMLKTRGRIVGVPFFLTGLVGSSLVLGEILPGLDPTANPEDIVPIMGLDPLVFGTICTLSSSIVSFFAGGAIFKAMWRLTNREKAALFDAVSTRALCVCFVCVLCVCLCARKRSEREAIWRESQ